MREIQEMLNRYSSREGKNQLNCTDGDELWVSGITITK